MAKQNAFAFFLATELRKLGMTGKRAAESLGIEYTNYRSYAYRRKFPPDKLQQIAVMIGMTAAELKSRFGIEDVAEYTLLSKVRTNNVLPLLTSIVECKRGTLSSAELEFLVSYQTKLAMPMSPMLIHELLNHHFPPQK